MQERALTGDGQRLRLLQLLGVHATRRLIEERLTGLVEYPAEHFSVMP